MANNWYDVLEGAQIVEMDNDQIIVNKDGKAYVLDLETDHGDCCGYAIVKTELFYEKNSGRNPIITRIQTEEDETDYQEVTITFFGESKPLAAISCECGSGSGWHYGACVNVVCRPLGIDEIVCSW